MRQAAALPYSQVHVALHSAQLAAACPHGRYVMAILLSMLYAGAILIRAVVHLPCYYCTPPADLLLPGPTGDGSARSARTLSQAASGPMTTATRFPVTTVTPWP